MAVFRSSLSHVQLHDSGWHQVSDDVEITRRPLWDDEHQLWARFNRGDSLEWCAANACRLPTVAELKALHEASTWVAPVTLPAGPEMSSIEYARRHDAKAADLIEAIAASSPIANIGKPWEASGGLFGWRRADGSYIQGEPVFTGHGNGHADYSSTQYVARDLELDEAEEDDEADVPPPTPSGTRPTLRRGDRGFWVGVWQRVLVEDGGDLGIWGADEDFGGATERETRSWQRDEALTADGIVGAKTWAAAEQDDDPPISSTDPPPPSPVPLPPISYRQAKNYYPTRREGPPIWAVVHTSENVESSAGAEGLQAYAAEMPAGRSASWHYAVDDDSITQSCKESQVAYAAPGANGRGIQVELYATATQSAEQWRDDYSRAQLDLAARLFAHICHRHDIPARRVGPTEMRAGEPGICGHVDATKAFKKSTHYDPGPHFPWDEFIAAVAGYLELLSG